MGHRMLPSEFFPEQQRNLGHNGLELALRKRYIEDFYVRWCVFEIGLFWYRQCAIIQKSTYAPPQKSYVKYPNNLYYLPTGVRLTWGYIVLSW